MFDPRGGTTLNVFFFCSSQRSRFSIELAEYFVSVEGSAGLNCLKQYYFEECGRRIDVDGFMKLSKFYHGLCLGGILRSDTVSVAENETSVPFLRTKTNRQKTCYIL